MPKISLPVNKASLIISYLERIVYPFPPIAIYKRKSVLYLLLISRSAPFIFTLESLLFPVIFTKSLNHQLKQCY